MKKIVKISSFTLIIIFLLLLILPFAFKEKIMKIAKDEANKNLNAKIEFKDLSLSFFRDFPKFSIRIEDFSIRGKKEFQKDTLFSVAQLDFAVDVTSIFDKAIQIRKISIEKPRIKAHVLKDGRANWDIVPEDSSVTPESQAAESADTSSSALKMALQKLQINKAIIVYDDEEGNMKAEIKNIDFMMSGDLTTSTTDLKISTSIQTLNFDMDGIHYLKNAKINFDAGIFADLDKYQFTFKKNQLSINNLKLNFDGMVDVSDSVNVGMDLKFSSPVNTFKSLLSLVPAIYKQDFEGLETKGNFTLNGFAKGDFNTNTLATPIFEANLKVKDGYFKYPDLPKSVDNVNIATKIASTGGDMNNITVAVSSFHVELAGNPFDVNLLISHPMTNINIAGKMKGTLDFSSIQDIVPLDSMKMAGMMKTDIVLNANMSDINNDQYEKVTADGQIIFSHFSYEIPDLPKVLITDALLKFSPRYVDLQKFDMNIGRSDLHLQGKVEKFIPYVFSDGILTGKLALQSNLFDANEFLTGEKTPEETPETEITDTIPLEAFQIPENISFEFVSNMKEVHYDKLKIENILGKISLKKGKLNMDNLKMNMLKGSVSATGFYEALNIEKPNINFVFGMKNIDIPSTYKAFNTIKKLAPIAKQCSGAISASFNLNTSLDKNLNLRYETLNSVGRLQTKEIGLQDNQIFNGIADKTKYEKLRNPKFNDINLKYKIIDGNLEIEPFKLKIAGYQAEIGGKQSITGNIDYQITTTLPHRKLGDLAAGITGAKVSKADFKIFIGGTLSKPKITKVESNALESAKDEVTDKLKEQAGEKAQQIIDEVQKKADALISEAQKQAAAIRQKAKQATDKLISEADKQGKALIKKAGNNPLKKIAAQEAAKKLNQQAKDKAKKVVKEADNQANNLVNKAKQESDKIISNARAQNAKQLLIINGD